MLTQLQQQLAPWHRATPPVPDIPREHARGVQWVEPVFVGEVAYRTWTPDGHLRHPSWRGLRPDRTPADARREPSPATAAGPGAVPAVVDGSMRTADGGWQVDVMRRDDRRWYRIRHGDNLIDDLGIDDVEALLAAAGVDLSGLTDAAPVTRQAPAVSA
jgi:bifunctional non-homologous end joining protein LigD